MIKNCRDKYLIIGAGPLGLAMAAACSKKKIAYDQVEADESVGGNWLHGVYATTHIISSKKATEFSDYKMPKHYPDFPSAFQMLEYLKNYTHHFNLKPNIQFHTKVIKALPQEDGSWKIEFVIRETIREVSEYKGVIVCTGHHWDVRYPKHINDSMNFTGEIIHSKHYNKPAQLENKRVLIVGSGNSACDIASEAARVGRSSHISMRRGTWFLPKVVNGRPLTDSKLRYFPLFIQRYFIKRKLKIIVGDYRDYGLPVPKDKIFDRHPTLNLEILHYLKHGRIQVRPPISKFEQGYVFFEDGTKEEYDILVFATGFHLSYPFLPKDLIAIEGAVLKTYAGVLSDKYKNIYFFGWQQLRSGLGPITTMASDVISKMLGIQERMHYPIGFVMKMIGLRPDASHLRGPISGMLLLKIGEMILPAFCILEKVLGKRLKKNFHPSFDFDLEGDPNMRVY